MEPQCTYYLLNDFSTGQMIWMGEKSRLLNEFEEIKSELDSIRNDIDMVVDPSAELAAMPDDIVEKGRNLLMRISDYNIDHGSPGFGRDQADLQVQSLMLESMHSSPIVRDLCTAAFFTNIIDYKRESLPTVLEDCVDSVISHPSVRNAGHLSSMSMQIHVMAVSFL